MSEARNNSQRGLLIVVLALVIVAVIASLFAHWLARFPGDLRLTLLFQSVDGSALLPVMTWVSYLAGGWRAAVLVLVSAVIVWRCLGRLESGLVVLAGLSSLANDALKLAIDRPRPGPGLVTVFEAETGTSFPSGHAFFAVVVLGFLAYLAATHVRRRGLGTLAVCGLLALVLLVGASRVYLGVHWPSDVLGGYLAGGTFLAAFIWSYRTLERRLSRVL